MTDDTPKTWQEFIKHEQQERDRLRREWFERMARDTDTQTALAKKINISRSQLWRLMSGVGFKRPDHWRKNGPKPDYAKIQRVQEYAAKGLTSAKAAKEESKVTGQEWTTKSMHGFAASHCVKFPRKKPQKPPKPAPKPETPYERMLRIAREENTAMKIRTGDV